MDLKGKRAQLLNIIDTSRADAAELEPLYTVEVTVSKSPGGVKCGAITVFRTNPIAFDYERLLARENMSHEELAKALAASDEIQREASKQTDTMHMDPIYFKQAPPDGRWIPWALKRALELYDQFGGSARLMLKCPRLKIRVSRSPRDVAQMRSDLNALFPVVRDIDELLDREFKYDPWRKEIHRGIVGPRK